VLEQDHEHVLRTATRSAATRAVSGGGVSSFLSVRVSNRSAATLLERPKLFSMSARH
jgi:hypothetical protein